jgi:sterol desaturase/sphingolipid hydroxylase (fatty acid hydroxylase superfamily)|tara:strand:+ start:593 stop:1456 length:864 start_codon:yes stop_codon:yes gene_type:complete
MNYIDKQFEAFADVLGVLEAIGLGFLLLIIAETLWDFSIKKRVSLKETTANFIIAIANHLLDRTLFGLVFILGLFIAQTYAFFTISTAWWSWIMAILMADFTYYWMHRCEHQVRVLWSYHSVHHSSPEFNLTTGLRLAWVEGMVEWLFFVPMILIGFSAIQTFIALSIVVLYQTWIHTEKIGKLGWVDRVFNTPSVHRVHHGSNKPYHDKNYGGILIIWDRLFGTYKSEQEKVVYGITTPISSWNPLIINFHEFWKIIKDILKTKKLSDAVGFLFYRPGWKPKDRGD